MTIAIYARKSVERQDSVSIDTQIEEYKTRVPQKVNIQVYQDEGFSGKDTACPDLQRPIAVTGGCAAVDQDGGAGNKSPFPDLFAKIIRGFLYSVKGVLDAAHT